MRGTRFRLVVLGIAALLVLEILASLVWPAAVPRLSLLPKPPDKSWNDGCNAHSRTWKKEPLIWSRLEVSTLKACPHE